MLGSEAGEAAASSASPSIAQPLANCAGCHSMGACSSCLEQIRGEAGRILASWQGALVIPDIGLDLTAGDGTGRTHGGAQRRGAKTAGTQAIGAETAGTFCEAVEICGGAAEAQHAERVRPRTP
ncbi:hypothetical protein CRENBAI_022150 [Crenichthys baileyi]|uniref:Uncharacterized protein n=1 Tax=Crenichthys baileyi TaxID=28760 RepID=A0AAV9RWK3_9TELE